MLIYFRTIFTTDLKSPNNRKFFMFFGSAFLTTRIAYQYYSTKLSPQINPVITEDIQFPVTVFILLLLKYSKFYLTPENKCTQLHALFLSFFGLLFLHGVFTHIHKRQFCNSSALEERKHRLIFSLHSSAHLLQSLWITKRERLILKS